MGSHLACIGISSSPQSYAGELQRLLEAGALLGETDAGAVRVYAYDDPSGSRVTFTVTGSALACLTPTFRPGALLTAKLGPLAGNDCPFERPLLVEVHDGGEEMYPVAIQLEDLAIRAGVPGGAVVRIELAALAETIEVFPDEDAYRASGTPMAVRSLIPSGTFAPHGSPGGESFAVSPRILMSGVVESSELRTHSLLGGSFVHLTVGSYGARYEVLVAVPDLSDGAGSVRLPPAGAIVSGQFWLSGRLIE